MKKITALLLAVFLIIPSLVPISALAEAVNPTITVESVSEGAGATVEVAVTIKDNPGIMGATLSFTYDSGLTLISATAGDAFSALTMTKPGNYASPSRFVWDGQDLNAEDIKDGTILTLRFEIDENAKSGNEYDIRVSYYDGDIIDANMNPIDVTLVSGCVSIFDYTPGDLNGDKNVGTADIIMLRRHIAGGYEQTLNELAGDVNGDGRHNTTDVILIRRFVAGGYDVVLLPGNLPKAQCAHIMTAFSYLTPTCTIGGNTAYWRCGVCDKFFEDENGAKETSYEGTRLNPTGHTVVIDAAVAPTYENTGLTEGKHCSVCNEVILEQTVIPALHPEEYSIIYHIDNNDAYLQSLGVENPNPAVYSTHNGLTLQHLLVDGYNFIGWYTASVGGNEVTKIQPGEAGNRTLYARWGKIVYTIQFRSDMAPMPDMTYTVGVERTLPKPTGLSRYTFTGWGDENGNIVNTISRGMTGDVILYANWVADRNKATAVSRLEAPVIIEDPDSGLILFTYEIGQIGNVLLHEEERIPAINGLDITVQKTISTTISNEQVDAIAKTIYNSTTNSASWTLSSDWNNTTEVSERYLQETGMSREDAEEIARSSSNTYNTTKSSGGATSFVNVENTNTHVTNNKGTVDVVEKEKEHNVGLSVGGKQYGEVSAGISVPIPGAKVSAGAKTGYEITAGAEYGYKNNTKTTGTKTDMTLTVNDDYKSNTSTSDAYWNESSAYSSSNSLLEKTSIKNTISEVVSNEFQKGTSYSDGGSNSETQNTAETNGKDDEYRTALTYYTSEINTTTRTYKASGVANGAYRLGLYGSVNVFAVVGYDVANNTYFMNTYNVLDERVYDDVDYSYTGKFDDYETSFIPFEVPYFVDEYVSSRIAKTDGLRINTTTGMITGYTPASDNPDNIIVIPSYWRSANGTAVKVTGISPGLFKNNTDIKAVQLGNYITEIPDSAFEGCLSLEYVLAPGVTKIGNNAFHGCTSLDKFTVPRDITELGANAFEGVPEIGAVASSAEIAQAVASSGAENITLDISYVPKDEANGIELNVGEITSFELHGGGKEYKGLSLKSDAETTVIKGVTFSENTKIPLELSSENVNLIRVTINSTGFALVLTSEQTNILLNGDVNLNSTGDNAFLCKNVNLAPWSSNEDGILKISGNVLVCGDISNRLFNETDFEVTEGEIIYITDEEFENYRSSHRVYFDANGGTVNIESRLVPFNALMGELPIPSRDYYTFDGWYTEAEGGELITAETTMTALTDITLYARWLQNDVSAWTLAANIPGDAVVVGREWRYTQRYETTSGSSSMSGWTQFNSTYVMGNWSGWSTTNPGTGNGRNRDERWIAPTYKTGYHYYRYYSPSAGMWTYPNNGAQWQETYFDWILPNAQGYTDIKSTNGSKTSSTMWCQADLNYAHNNSDRTFVHLNHFLVTAGYYQYRYQDRVYTYYFYRTENLTSQTNPTGKPLVSNVQEWVQYRAK